MMLRLLVALLFCITAAAADSIVLKPVQFSNGKWLVGSEASSPQFRAAISSNKWAPGLVPLFVIEKAGVRQLRRFPMKGTENIADPVFFGLPLADEKPYIGGRWDVSGTQREKRQDFYWELLVDGTNITGQFDRDTDYRFATLHSGSFASNHLDLRIDYVMDSYLLAGTLSDGKFSGTWKRSDGGDSGTWEAKQSPVALPADTNTIPLFEWKNGNQRAYVTGTNSPGVGWTRSEKPLCRVWK